MEESGRGEREADSPPRLLHKTTIGFSLSAEDEIFLLIIIHGKIQLVLFLAKIANAFEIELHDLTNISKVDI